MTRFLGVVLLLALAVGAVGWYLGWFKIGTNKEGDKTNVTFTVDQDKIDADKKAAVEKVRDLSHKAQERVGRTNGGTKEKSAETEK